ncbi:MAG: MATE family efflux transporter, partial [Pseudomonadales bacterium]|nr:MATE family efflux transporter [Pseudomonadales bacterium]
MVEARLTEGSISKHLFHMALPMVIGLFANMSIQAVDMWFISKLGQDPLAAMGFIFPVAMLFLSLSIGLSAGAASVVARQISAGDLPHLKRLVTDTQTLAFFLALIAAIVGWLTIDPLFGLLGAGEHLMPLIRSYMQIFYFNGLLTMLGMVALSVVRATGNTKAQGLAMLLGAILNAILDPILIFGLFGFPRLEMQGAALASMAARLLSLAFAYYFLIGKMSLLTSPFVSLARMLQSWRAILHIALPAMGTNIIIPL